MFGDCTILYFHTQKNASYMFATYEECNNEEYFTLWTYKYNEKDTDSSGNIPQETSGFIQTCQILITVVTA